VISVSEAQTFVLETLTPLSPVDRALEEALGCVAAEQIIATEPVPGFKNSSMDGYALRAADTSEGSVRLRVIGTVLAGDAPDQQLQEGEAVRIMTGAPIPDGADAVCMIEETTVDPDGQTVLIARTIDVGQSVRQPGEDIAVGQLLIKVGRELGGGQIGVLASQGCASVSVHPRPRVGVMSTGDELAGPGSSLSFGQIRDANRPMLLALLRQSGFTPVDLGIASDDEQVITKRLQLGVDECDAVIATGGVSVGDVDFVKTVLAEIYAGKARWMQVAMRPGKPFAFGTAGERGTPIFGLPGNPVSTRVSFEMFVRPALRRLAGHRVLERPTVNMVLDCPMARKPDGKLHLVHVTSRFHDDGRMHIEGASRQGSHLLSAVAGANALAMIPDGAGFAPGDVARAMILDHETGD
jgi:molybdenum cofactor synthesis domain-containing protein